MRHRRAREMKVGVSRDMVEEKEEEAKIDQLGQGTGKGRKGKQRAKELSEIVPGTWRKLRRVRGGQGRGRVSDMSYSIQRVDIT